MSSWFCIKKKKICYVLDVLSFVVLVIAFVCILVFLRGSEARGGWSGKICLVCLVFCLFSFFKFKFFIILKYVKVLADEEEMALKVIQFRFYFLSLTLIIAEKKRRIDSEEEEEDSELDDFIDDGDDDAANYSKEIKNIFGYDKSR